MKALLTMSILIVQKKHIELLLTERQAVLHLAYYTPLFA
jgi:hypothetical protein